MWTWITVGLLLLTAEFVIPGVFICFFGLSALIIGFWMWLEPGLAWYWQGFFFALFGIVLLLLLRRLIPGNTKSRDNKIIEEDDIAGKTAVVSKAIHPPLAGKIDFRGSEWSAEAGNRIEAGACVRIISRKNITFIVEESK